MGTASPRAALVELLVALSACTPRPETAAVPRPPAVIVADVADLARAEAGAELVEEQAPVAAAETPAVTLSLHWLVSTAPTTPHREALSEAKNAHARVVAALGVVDGGTISASWFERLERNAELSSMWYATAFHASDASAPQKITAVLDAATSALFLSKELEKAGLAQLPRTWRADPSIAVTFEDVARGPAKRWWYEGLALVELCVEAAHDAKVEDGTVERCRSIRKKLGRVAIRRAFGRDAGERGCRCQAGDPLCSESAGWCARR